MINTEPVVNPEGKSSSTMGDEDNNAYFVGISCSVKVSTEEDKCPDTTTTLGVDYGSGGRHHINSTCHHPAENSQRTDTKNKAIPGTSVSAVPSVLAMVLV